MSAYNLHVNAFILYRRKMVSNTCSRNHIVIMFAKRLIAIREGEG